MEFNTTIAVLVLAVCVIALVYIDGLWRNRRHSKRDFDKQPVDESLVIDPIEDELGEVRIVPAEPMLAEAEQGLPAEPEDYLAIILTTGEGREIRGDLLLQSLLNLGLRFDDQMGIFHRRESARGQGRIQFSLANAMQPGVFNIHSMESFRTTGLCLFMTLPGPTRPMQAFTNMTECARILAQEFGANLLDTQRSVFSVQTASHYRDKIRNFELQHRSHQFNNRF